MTIGQRHTIGKQFLDIRYNGSETGAMALQSAISGLNRHGIAPKIEQILDRHAADGSVLKIDRLEVDAGAVPLDQLEARLPAMIAEALEKSLCEMATPDAEVTSKTLSQTDGKRLTVAEAAVEALLFFLRHGTLPATWRLQSHESFETQLLEASSGGDLMRQTAEALASQTARQRLLTQFSRQIPVTLLEKLLPGAMPVIENLLGEFRRSGFPAGSVTRIEQELLDHALALSATRTVIAPEKLQAMLAEIAMRLPEVAEIARTKMPGDETETKTRSRSQQRPSATDSADGETARQTRDSAPQAKRENGETPQSTPDADAQNKKSPKNASLDENRTPSGHQRSDRSDGVTETPPDAVSDAIAKSPTTPDSSSGSRDTNASDRTTGNLTSERKREPSASVKSADHPATTSQASFSDSGSDSTAKNRDSGKQRTMHPDTQEVAGEHPDERRGLYVENAGLVLLHPFLPQLFRALKIAGDAELLRPGEALRLLYYLATGLEDAPEYDLVLPKILCGLQPASLAGEAAPFTDEEREESAALLAAVVRHWEALKNTGIDALRETFLKRNGKLTRWHDGGWLLQVESKSVDILLDSLPWGISMIRLPWMARMLHVEWGF
jgi:hypothetical protein